MNGRERTNRYFQELANDFRMSRVYDFLADPFCSQVACPHANGQKGTYKSLAIQRFAEGQRPMGLQAEQNTERATISCQAVMVINSFWRSFAVCSRSTNSTQQNKVIDLEGISKDIMYDLHVGCNCVVGRLADNFAQCPVHCCTCCLGFHPNQLQNYTWMALASSMPARFGCYATHTHTRTRHLY